jgi:hypothetical protein
MNRQKGERRKKNDVGTGGKKSNGAISEMNNANRNDIQRRRSKK